MLLKIYTSQNTIKVIDRIQNVEIHEGEWRPDNYSQLYDAVNFGPGVLRANAVTPAVESFDWEPWGKNETPSPAQDVLIGNLVKFVDYERDNEWGRVAIQQYAYLCNDEGRTIQKIGA